MRRPPTPPQLHALAHFREHPRVRVGAPAHDHRTLAPGSPLPPPAVPLAATTVSGCPPGVALAAAVSVPVLVLAAAALAGAAAAAVSPLPVAAGPLVLPLVLRLASPGLRSASVEGLHGRGVVVAQVKN